MQNKGFFSIAVGLLAFFVLLLVLGLSTQTYNGYDAKDEFRNNVLITEESYFIADKTINNWLNNYTLGDTCDDIILPANLTTPVSLVNPCVIDSLSYTKSNLTDETIFNVTANIVCAFDNANYKKEFSFKKSIKVSNKNDDSCMCNIAIYDYDAQMNVVVHSYGDTDGDGVGNVCDDCPDTLPNVLINSSGCPITIQIP